MGRAISVVVCLLLCHSAGRTAFADQPAQAGVGDVTGKPLGISPAKGSIPPCPRASSSSIEYDGRVVDTKGRPVNRATIRIIAYVEHRSDGYMTFGADNDSAACQTNDHGRFQLRGEWDKRNVSCEVAIRDATRTGFGELKHGKGNLLVIPRATSIRIKFVGPDGRPAPKIKVIPRDIFDDHGSDYMMTNSVWATRCPTQSDTRGIIDWAGLPQGYHVAVRIDSPDYARTIVDVHLGTTARSPEQLVRLQRYGSFEGFVINHETRKPIAGAMVTAIDNGRDQDIQSENAITDSTGHYVISGLAAGTYDLLADCQSPSPGNMFVAPTVSKRKLAVGTTVTLPTIEFVRAARISGRVTDVKTHKGIDGFGLSVSSMDNSWSEGVDTDEDGDYTIFVLPGIEYVLQPDDGCSPAVNVRPTVASAAVANFTSASRL